jgi:hypothetical protein
MSTGGSSRHRFCDGDAFDVAVEEGRIVGVRGRAGDRANHGRLDPKDLFGWQANAAAVGCNGPWSERATGWSHTIGFDVLLATVESYTAARVAEAPAMMSSPTSCPAARPKRRRRCGGCAPA